MAVDTDAESVSPQSTPPVTGPKKGLTKAQEIGIAGGVLVVILIIGIVVSNSNNPSLTSPTNSPSWHTVSTFSGAGDMNTTTFTLRGNESRLQWSYYTNQPEIALFSVFVYTQSDPYVPVTQAVCRDVNTDLPYSCPAPTSSRESGTQHINYGPNTLYLEMITTVTSWNIVVEDYY